MYIYIYIHIERDIKRGTCIYIYSVKKRKNTFLLYSYICIYMTLFIYD